MRWIVMATLGIACAGGHGPGVELVVSPGGGDPELVAEVLRARLKAGGARRPGVEVADGRVHVRVRPDEVDLARAAVVPGRVTFTWEGHPRPFLDGPVFTRVTCVEQISGQSLSVQLARADGAVFGRETAAHVGDVLQVAVDGEVIVAPEVREPIRGGSAILPVGGRGACTRLAVRVAGGALPAGVSVVEERRSAR